MRSHKIEFVFYANLEYQLAEKVEPSQKNHWKRVGNNFCLLEKHKKRNLADLQNFHAKKQLWIFWVEQYSLKKTEMAKKILI